MYIENLHRGISVACNIYFVKKASLHGPVSSRKWTTVWVFQLPSDGVDKVSTCKTLRNIWTVPNWFPDHPKAAIFTRLRGNRILSQMKWKISKINVLEPRCAINIGKCIFLAWYKSLYIQTNRHQKKQDNILSKYQVKIRSRDIHINRQKQFTQFNGIKFISWSIWDEVESRWNILVNLTSTGGNQIS